MMKNIEIKITKSTRYVDIENETQKVGNEGENLQSNLIFSFTDSFVDGQARLEYTIDGESRYVTLDKIGETYQTPVKSEMTKKGAVDMQLVITEGTEENEIPKFKSNVFYLPYGSSINAEVEQPEEYEEWIDVANTKLNQVDNLDIELQDNILTITKKDGTTKTENVKGDKGDKGDAGSIKFIIVSELPSEDIDESAIYMIPAGETSEGNTYIEYIYVNGAWESLGSASVNVDMADYPTREEMNGAINEVMNGTIKELTDAKIYLQNLDAGVYKLNGVTEIYYNNSSTYPGVNGTNAILIVSEKSGKRVGYLFLTGTIAVMTSTSLNTYTNNKILTMNNITEFTPTSDYNPVHKKYVDEAIANNSGTIYEVQLNSIKLNSSTTNKFGLDDTDKNKLSELLTKICSDSVGYPIIIVRTENKFMFTMISDYDLTSEPNSLSFWGYYNYPNMSRTNYGVNYYQLSITGICSWNNGVCTISSCSANRENYQYLSKTNTLTYNPTGNYHPATKKYVDDAIATLKAELSGGTE